MIHLQTFKDGVNGLCGECKKGDMLVINPTKEYIRENHKYVCLRCLELLIKIERYAHYKYTNLTNLREYDDSSETA